MLRVERTSRTGRLPAGGGQGPWVAPQSAESDNIRWRDLHKMHLTKLHDKQSFLEFARTRQAEL